MLCKICNKSFKRLTHNHLRTHGYNLELYNKEFEPNKYRERILVKFLNDYYIDLRYKFVEYYNGQIYTVNTKIDARSWSLCDRDILEHLRNKKTIGILFPQNSSKLIGLDIDTDDVHILNRVYSAIKSYGIDESYFLITNSGGKGYHFDIFLSGYLDKVIINKFYKTLLDDIEVSQKTVELRGGGGQGYKLPFGYHQTTGNKCDACDEWGNSIEFEPHGMKKLAPEIIADIVEINYSDVVVDHKLSNEFEELAASVKLLESHARTNENTIREIEKLVKTGVNEKGKRHVKIRTLASYCKDILGYCTDETINYINNWIKDTWNKKIIDREILKSVKITVNSVYKTKFKFKVHANIINVYLPDIKEIFSVKTNNKLETETLRRLYYILLLQSRAYSGENGVFYMSYKQIASMGGNTKSSIVLRQIKKLEKMGKVIIVERNRNAGNSGSKFKRPNLYKLPQFLNFTQEITLKNFQICEDEQKCKDCLYKAACFLAENQKERKNFIKGSKFRELKECKYSNRKALKEKKNSLFIS